VHPREPDFLKSLINEKSRVQMNAAFKQKYKSDCELAFLWNGCFDLLNEVVFTRGLDQRRGSLFGFFLLIKLEHRNSF
jgi:hypothetical protein